MIRHIVMWKLKEAAHNKNKSVNAQTIKSKLESLRGKIKGMRLIEVGHDISQTDKSSDIVLYSEFDSKDALETYQKHPDHESFKIWIAEATTERRIVDYETP